VVKSIKNLRCRLFDALVLTDVLRPRLEALLEAHRPLLRGLMSTGDLKRFETTPSTHIRQAVATYSSVFISYGSPDEAFAERLNRELRSRGVKTFFFRHSALPGQRLHRLMSDGVNEHDRVVLICSKDSLNRAGVLNEIEQVLAREAREGGSEILIPLRLDDYVFSWKPTKEDIARQIRDRVIPDFACAVSDTPAFDACIFKLLAALKVR
jgi:hypothetical protein